MSTISTTCWLGSIPAYKLSTLKWFAFLFTFVTASVAAPYACHQFGLAGIIFLPMHFSVMLAALVMGYRGGIAVALTSPILSYALSGMPPAISLFPMTIELITYAIIINLTARTFKLPVIASLIISMITGRVISILLVSIILRNMPIAAHMQNVFLIGLPGILIQLAFVPLLTSKIIDFLKEK